MAGCRWSNRDWRHRWFAERPPGQGWKHKELAGSKLTGKQWAHSRSPDSGPGARSPFGRSWANRCHSGSQHPGRNCGHWNSVFSSDPPRRAVPCGAVVGHGAGGEMWVTHCGWFLSCECHFGLLSFYTFLLVGGPPLTFLASLAHTSLP